MPFRHLPIKRKIVAVILSTAITVLIISGITLLAYEVFAYRRSTARNMATTAAIIAANSSAALAFNDRKEAEEVLSGLRAEPNVKAAALYDKAGKLYVVYPATTDVSKLPAAAGPDGAIHGMTEFSLFQGVHQGTSREGTLFLRFDLNEMYQRLGVFGLVLLAVVGGSTLLAVAFSNFLQRQISAPVLELAETAKSVSVKHDYSVRARRLGNDELGDLTAAFNTMLDQIQQSHSALLASEARLTAVFQQAAAGIAQNDLEGRFLLVNDRYCEILGLDRAELLRRRLGDVIPAADWFVLEKGIVPEERRGTAHELEFEYTRPDGRRIWLRARIAAVRTAEGRIDSTMMLMEDITDRKQAALEVERARDAAEKASRAKDDFVAALSHELRTPLNPVLLLASNAAVDPELPEEVRADFETIRKNVELEARLIDDLLDITAIARGKISVDLRPVDAGAALRDAIGTVQAEVDEKKLRLEVTGTDCPCLVHGDPVRLQQIFWNVLRNAVKFTPAGGSIRIAMSAPEGQKRLVVTIADSGIGLTEKELGIIFESFAQGEHAVEGGHRFGGMGLGLAISRMLVDVHGGRIRATSAGRNKGATFTIELPLVTGSRAPVNSAAHAREKDPGAPPVRPPSVGKPAEGFAPAAETKPLAGFATGGTRTAGTASSRPPGKNILLVEDHEPTRKALTQLLSARRHTVSAAANVEEARRFAANGTFDLLISDIGLPDGNGYELMVELNGSAPLKGIALSGYGMEQDIARSREAGFVSHLTKPVSIKALEKALADAG